MTMTQMELETRQVPSIIAKQLKENDSLLRNIAARLDKSSLSFVMTIGRGSSDHACTYAKYLIETQLGLVTASSAPSVLTLYRSQLKVKNALVIGISQSGQSPDICEVMQSARKNGAITLAIVNQADSPLAEASEFVVPIGAGVEKSVAATKSYIASLTVLLQLVAIWSKNKDLFASLGNLSEKLQEALEKDWSAAIPLFRNIEDTLILARGLSFAIAQEAALKCKETASIQAEAYSAAEVLHGPFALIKKNHPYLLIAQNDQALKGVLTLSRKIKEAEGKSILAVAPNLLKGEDKNCADLILPLPVSENSIQDPLLFIQSFYVMIAKIAVERGLNPDAPVHLKKITETR